MKKFSIMAVVVAALVSLCALTSCTTSYSDRDYDNGIAYLYGSNDITVKGTAMGSWTVKDPVGKMTWTAADKCHEIEATFTAASQFKFIVNGSYWSKDKVVNSPNVKGTDDGFGGVNLMVTEAGTYAIKVDIINEKITITKE